MCAVHMKIVLLAYLEAEHQCNDTKWPEAAQEGEDGKIEIITRRIWPVVAFWVDKACNILYQYTMCEKMKIFFYDLQLTCCHSELTLDLATK